LETKKTDESKKGLELLRKPFPENLISKLPKPTKQQTEDVKANFRNGIRCQLCGAWHHPEVVHLDYVGHAALTDRLLEADPEWTWEPMAKTQDGLPLFDKTGGLWIRLTVCGVTRLGYGHADEKQTKDAGAREKEVIGDALRNAAMRFGAALDLWHKGDLHPDEDQTKQKPESKPPKEKVESKPAAKPSTVIKPKAQPIPANRPLTATERMELSKWQITGGKYKGKKLGEIPFDEIMFYRTELANARDPIGPAGEDLIKRIDAYYQEMSS